MVNISFLFPVAAQVNSHQTIIPAQWLGEWDVRWKSTLGEQFGGTSRLSRPREDGLLKEELRADSGAWDGWRGITLAKFNAQTKTWHYAWQDNRGGYCDFIGQFTNRIFSIQFVNKEGVCEKQRMTVRSIDRKKIIWDCEQYDINTGNWRKSWKIEYHRH